MTKFEHESEELKIDCEKKKMFLIEIGNERDGEKERDEIYCGDNVSCEEQ